MDPVGPSLFQRNCVCSQCVGDLFKAVLVFETSVREKSYFKSRARFVHVQTINRVSVGGNSRCVF